MKNMKIKTIRMSISLVAMIFAGIYIDTFEGLLLSIIGTVNGFDLIKEWSDKYYE